MKKTLTFLFVCIFAAALVHPVQAAQDPTNIPIIRSTDPGENLSRSPEVVPFIAEYNDLWDAVVLTSIMNIGDVTVTLVSTAGDWYQTVFDTEDGMILIPASGESGYYTLTIVTSDNTTYQGEFVL